MRCDTGRRRPVVDERLPGGEIFSSPPPDGLVVAHNWDFQARIISTALTLDQSGNTTSGILAGSLLVGVRSLDAFADIPGSVWAHRMQVRRSGFQSGCGGLRCSGR